MFRIIRNVSNVLRWQKLRSEIARGNYVLALEGFRRLRLPNGPKQVAIIHQANCCYYLGMLKEAKALYDDATESEVQWSKRPSLSDSIYIRSYADFFSKLIDFQHETASSEDVLTAFDRMLESRASTELIEIQLPPPNRSTVILWLKKEASGHDPSTI